MDTSYKAERTQLSIGQHEDAKEVNDLINALVNSDSSMAAEAIEAVLALLPDMASSQRFIHLYKVLTAVMDNQLQARFLENT
jgi:hypothetical protein